MLIRPIPFPEEIDRGYLGRVMRFNGCAKEEDAIELMRVWVGCVDKSWREVSSLELLSRVAGVELPTFVRRHTSLPLRRGITSYQPDLHHGCESNKNMLWSTGMRVARTGAYFCEMCAKEDVGFHGQSYWRREHQMPGLLWCPKHMTPLRYLDDESAFFSPPSSLMENSQVVDASWSNEIMGNETVLRYLQICWGLMERTLPLAVKAVSAILRGKASSAGFQTYGGPVRAPLLSDAVIERCGRTWLATVLPVLADKPDGILSSQLDGVLYLTTSASSVSAYALASALLFDTADDALNNLTGPVPAVIHGRQRRTVDIGREALIAGYVQARGSHSQTAALLAIPNPAAAKRLNALGLPNLIESPSKNTVKAAVAFFVDKVSFVKSAELGGIGQDAMEDLIRTSGAGLVDVLNEMHRPSGGRGSGIRRPLQLTPAEATATSGRKAVKYSHSLRPEQRRLAQPDLIETQKVLQ